MTRPVLFIFLLAALLWAGACETQQQAPENLIEENAYIDMLAELQLVKSYRQSIAQDSVSADSLERMVYEKYGVSEERFRESHQYYSSQYEKQKERVDEAIERLRMDLVKSDTASSGNRQ